LAAAMVVGADIARLEADLASDEIKKTIEENFKLAEALGINGTPSYVVGDDLVVGAAGLETLKTKIKQARGG
jgi:protein-disulfide isomerase